MSEKDDVVNAMNEAADAAEDILKKMSKEEVESVGKWWQEWYLKAGHKRLGRILVKRMKELDHD